MLTLNILQGFTKKSTAKPYYLLVIHATLSSGNPLCFEKYINTNYGD